MLTRADDYPVHQLPEPIATAGTDRNFYDRYFFNGYTLDGSVFFAAALGVYPHLNVMDAAFSVIVDGVQHNLHASRLLNMERMDTRVGPITIEVVEPLRSLRVKVQDHEHNIHADVVFHARAKPVEEPRFTFRQGPRTMMDYTRLTQNGAYEGSITINGKTIELSREMVLGTRDRSWGVRPIGLSDPQPAAPPLPPQFYWLWSPLNFPDRFMLYHINANADGTPWNTASVLGGLEEAEPVHMASCGSELAFKPGTRHAKSAVIETRDPAGGQWRVELKPLYQFYMSGIGYGHPEWGHGQYKGELAVGYDTYDLATVNENDPRFLHIQAFVTARLNGPGVERVGAGVLEQLILGPHRPSGFKDLLDTAP
ncbi:MAG: hypothetical protein J0I26_07550 [Alphaproteobacteria bacterium]|jgi:hypothetical protein|nr:hypothetical protein [Alphaproteobacteria bacterium]MBN9557367.1 hypothetical protein [Alphaproteobacteria bacterium]MBN9568106.1 hypothetical protein [Alphaproteobacteria bacterium]MBN9571296.1 hypothetical protein [Alphaproteobacteria bacterium]MBN9579184.1 hypothetical protein [Alphaproteobacteria bacterium]